MGWGLRLGFALSIIIIEPAHALVCSPAGKNEVCSWTDICVPVHKPGIPPPIDPKALPPLPGERVSCANEEANENDWNWNCNAGIEIELKSCELWLSDEGEGNRIEFTVKNHSRVTTHTSNSARWGHLGINPKAAVGPANDPDLPANPDRDDQSTFEKDYPQYKPDNAMSESMPNTIVFPPLSEKNFQHTFVTDFPPIAACHDIVYMYVTQDGTKEPPHLWNRNHACDVEVCYQRNFRKCKVHRGSKTPVNSAPAKY